MDDENSNYIDQIHEKEVKFKTEMQARLAEDKHKTVFSSPNFDLHPPSGAGEPQENWMEELNQMDIDMNDGLEELGQVLVNHYKNKSETNELKQGLIKQI